MASTQFATVAITGPVTIDNADNVVEASIQVTSGTITVTGNRPFKGLPSEAITLANGSVLTISAKDGQYAIDGVAIDASGGGANLIVSF